MSTTKAWLTFDIFWTTESEDARAKFYAENPSSFDDGAANDLVSSASNGKIYPVLTNYEGSRKGSDGGICVSIPEEYLQEWQEAAAKEGAYLHRITRETAANRSCGTGLRPAPQLGRYASSSSAIPASSRSLS